MSAMIPGNTGKDRINTHPGNRSLRLGVSGELLDGRLILGDRDVAFHTLACGWECHQFARVRIRVAILALQTKRQMFLVAIGERLHRRGVLGRVVGYHLLRRL